MVSTVGKANTMSDAARRDRDEPEDRRQEPRRRTVLAGIVVHGSKLYTTECAILDISKVGARVRIPATEVIGQPIFLVNISHGLAFEAYVTWRRADRIGLKFRDYFDLSKPNSGGSPLLRQLWIERQGR
jgi:hypothetical protein